jgi:16S rRNA processing protein RimM
MDIASHCEGPIIRRLYTPIISAQNRSMSEQDILLAVIGAPHGIKGEVRVKSFTGDPLAFGDYGKLHNMDGRKFQVLNARLSKTVVVTRFKSVDSREKAEALNGVELFVDRSVLPGIEEEDEFYMADLVGLEAVSPEGERLGVVKEVHDFGAGDILEIKPENGAAELFPFARVIFPEVDLAGGRIVFVPPATVSEREEET